MAYKVVGGIYRDFTFKEVEIPEEHGPFGDREEAKKAWLASVWSNVDNALHRLKIVEVE